MKDQSVSKKAPPESLRESYRQSLRELWWIVGTWIVFALWNIASGALFAFDLPGVEEEVPVILGMPRWIFFTVLFPWLIGNVFIIWFALCFMKDTRLDEGETTEETDDGC